MGDHQPRRRCRSQGLRAGPAVRAAVCAGPAVDRRLALRQLILDAAPVPAAAPRQVVPPDEFRRSSPPEVTEPPELAGASKKARLAWWYPQDPDYGNRAAVAAVAKRLALKVDLSEGTARAYLGQILAEPAKAGEAS